MRIWVGMNTRCTNTNHSTYELYGGRGIRNQFVDYEGFYDWSMLNGYDDALSIDRIDNDGDYHPENCRWATRTVQSRNSRHCKLSAEDVGMIRALSEWGVKRSILADMFQVSEGAIKSIRRGVTWIEVEPVALT